MTKHRPRFYLPGHNLIGWRSRIFLFSNEWCQSETPSKEWLSFER